MNDLLLRAPRPAPMPRESHAAPAPAWRAPPAPYRTYVGIVRRHKLFIALATSLCALAGYLYAELATPIYQASMLVQVDELPAPTEHLLGEATSERDLRAATAPELEVLRSRLVVSRAVDSLRLFIDVRPRYLPVVGRWLATRYPAPLRGPGIGGYAWGAEHAEIARFEVPARLADRPFVLTMGPGESYVLSSSELGLRLAGQVGDTEHWPTPLGEVTLAVSELQARPGAQFLLRRRARLDSIERLQHDLKIEEQGKQSGVISVALEGADPEQLALILNEIGRQYVRLNEERRSADAGRALAFVEQQLPALKQSMEAAESRFSQARNRFGSIDLGEEGRRLLQQEEALQARRMELAQKRIELSGRFAANHPQMATIGEQDDGIKRELAAVGERIRRLPQVEQDIVRLSRDLKVSTEVYTAALASAQQLRLSAANRPGNARVLDPAEIPVRPIQPRQPLVVGAAAALGLLLSILAAAARKRWQGRVDDPVEVEQEFGLTVMAALPDSAGQRKLWARLAGDAPLPGPALLQLAVPRDGAVEGLRRLHALLQRALARADNRVVVIAGPGAAVGRTFVAANLAAVLAAAGKQVLLVDADLRAGRLHRVFGTGRGPGLAEYLAGRLDADAIVCAEVLPHVDLVPSGALPSDPGALLAQDRLRALLHSASLCYDYVVVDTSPVLPVSDALAVAALGAVTLNVVRSGVTSAAEIEESTRQLQQAGAHVAGVVVNGTRTHAARRA